jgi:predicted PurR-regulated permease PerM
VTPGSHDPHSETPGTADARLVGMIRLAGIILLTLGALAVLRVFLPAILLAGVVSLSTWPLFQRLKGLLGGRDSLAALVMVLGMIVLVAGPTALLSVQLADQVATTVERIKPMLEQAPDQPPAWLADLPLVGGLITKQWQTLAAGGDEAAALLRKLLDPAKELLLGLAGAIGGGLLQMLFAAFVGFFLFRDGEAIQRVLDAAMKRLAGGLGGDLLETIRLTVTSVVNGLFGAALAQALVALAGFLIAGVPGAFLLGSATFFVSIIPAGPPLLWGGATFWLFSQGHTGRGLFLLLWGLLLVSTVDNVVRPYLISRGSRMSMLLVVLGVVGGIAAFGFAGIFIGPPILAVGLALVRRWTAPQVS